MAFSILYKNVFQLRSNLNWRAAHLVVLFTITALPSYSQEKTPTKTFATNVFNDKQLVNTQTTEIPAGFEFRIQHRFGRIRFDESLINDFLGLDLPANIRFSLAYPIIEEKLQLAIGRTKFNKTVDFELKYRLLRQTEKKGTPLSLAIYQNTSFNTNDFPAVPDNSFFSDSTTVFKYQFSHRITYLTQIILSKKINKKISLQISPTFVYQNLVPDGRENITIALPFSGRFKFTRTLSGVFEYAHIFTNRTDQTKDPISLGIELGTVGHSFDFFMTSSNSILEQNLYTQDSFDYTQGYFAFGFNIRRVWWF